MIIDCIGCLHGAKPKLEGGDLLIVTGDLTARDTIIEHTDVLEWLEQQPYTKKVVIGGNHDNFLQKNTRFYSKSGITYLCDSGTEFEGLKIWGSPWSAQFKGINPQCCAFTAPMTVDMGDGLIDKWLKIPTDTDILITHTPAFGVLDGIPLDDGSLYHAGSRSLFGTLKYVLRPKLHAFSHIHEAHGQEEYFATHDDKMMISVNCSIMNERYRPVNKPVRIKL